MNVNRFEQPLYSERTEELRSDSRAVGYMGFAIEGVPSIADTFVQGASSVLRMKFSAKTPHNRKPLKRWQ